MIKPQLLLVATASLFALFTHPAMQAQTGTLPTSGDIVTFSKTFDLSSLKKVKTDVSLVETDQKTKLKINFNPVEKGWSFVGFPSPSGEWDLSAFTGIQVEVTNVSKIPLTVGLKAENAGNPPLKSSNGIEILPGDTATLQVTFGMTWGKPSDTLDTKAIGIYVFMYDPKPDSSVTIAGIQGVK